MLNLLDTYEPNNRQKGWPFLTGWLVMSQGRRGGDPGSIRCKLLWKLARMHTWSGFVREGDLLDAALDIEGHDDGRENIEELKNEPYTVFRRERGLRLKNDPDSQAIVAFELRDGCHFTELQIEATLSRFFQAGGFDTYDEPPQGAS